MTLRILVVESEPEDMLFLRDVLNELDGGPAWTNWTKLETLYASSWAEASEFLTEGAVDVVLLDLDLPDSQGQETYRRCQELAPQTPVILLMETTGPSLAQRLLREGAQDFLIKSEVDCAPLARAIRNAVDRHRVLVATRATSMLDPLTSLLNRTAFLLLAERDRVLAERLNCRMVFMLAAPKALDAFTVAHGDHARDLEFVKAAEHLRTLAGPTDLVARVSEDRLALVVFETEHQSAEAAWTRFRQVAEQRRISLGASVFDPRRPVGLDKLMELAEEDLTPAAVAAAGA
ncbi:MAG: response regulator [Acidobacteriota bacterium]